MSNEYEWFTHSDRPATLPIGWRVSANLHSDAFKRPCYWTPDGWRLCNEAVIIKSERPIPDEEKVLARLRVMRHA